MNDYIITCYDELAMWLGDNVDSMKEIVRCRDCKYKDESWNCAAPYYKEPDGFCAWGERKEN